MKKIIVCMIAAVMSMACTGALAQPHKPKKPKKVRRVEVVAPSHRTFGSRTISVIPSKSIYVSFNGLRFIYDEGGRYYRKLAPSRYEIVRPVFSSGRYTNRRLSDATMRNFIFQTECCIRR